MRPLAAAKSSKAAQSLPGSSTATPLTCWPKFAANGAAIWQSAGNAARRGVNQTIEFLTVRGDIFRPFHARRVLEPTNCAGDIA